MKVSEATANRAPIILIYGAEGRGKTSLAAKFPKPLGFLFERGLPRGVTLPAVDGLDSFEAMMGALREIYQAPGDYQSIIIDTVDSLEPLVIAHTCRTHGWADIETPGFGKGYVALDDTWRAFIKAVAAIRDKHNIAIILIAHASIDRIDDPRCPSFTAYGPKLHKRARGLVIDAADAVLFLDHDLRTVTDSNDRIRAGSNPNRYLFSEGCPSYVAKNRWQMPAKLLLPADFDIAELTKYWS